MGVTSGSSVTAPDGADLVYDAGGRDTFEMSLDMLATRGTLVLYGQSSGPVAPFDPGRLSGITGAGREAHARLASRTVLGKSSSRPERLRETPDVLGVRIGV